MAAEISTTAVIDAHARLGERVLVEDHCWIGGDVRVGSDCRLEHAATIRDRVRLGARNHLGPYVLLGDAEAPPLGAAVNSFGGELVVGADNRFGPFAVVHAGHRGRPTRIGSGCHVASHAVVHAACCLGDGSALGPLSILERGVILEDHVDVAAHVVVRPAVVLGAWCRVDELSRVSRDVPPYTVADGVPALPIAINPSLEGRLPEPVLSGLQRAFAGIYVRRSHVDEVRESLREERLLHPQVNHLLAFVQESQESRAARGSQTRRAA